MKKNILLVAAVAVLGLSASAQKPTEGANSSLEVQVNLSSGTTIDAPSLKYRYFIAPNMAVRFGLGYGSDKQSYNAHEGQDATTGAWTGSAGTYEIKDGGWMVMPGFEYHFAGTDKLSPYAGITLGLGGGTYTEDGANAFGTGDFDYAANYSYAEESKTSYFGWGIVFGADYYFAENFFFGAEFQFGGGTTTYKEGTSTETIAGTTTKSTTAEWKSGSMGIGSSTAGFRLGWRF